MVPCRILAFSTAALLIIVSARAEDAKLFFGEIPIQYVSPGEKVALDLHRFLHPPEASVRVDGADASFDAKAFTLTAKANAAGLSRWQITAELKDHKIVRMLVLAVEPSPSTRLTFKPVRPAQKVMIAGPFNSWNQNATAMNGPDTSGLSNRSRPSRRPTVLQIYRGRRMDA